MRLLRFLLMKYEGCSQSAAAAKRICARVGLAAAAALFTACTPTPDLVNVPTLAQLPTETPTHTPTESAVPTLTLTRTPTPTRSLTARPTLVLPTLNPTATATFTQGPTQPPTQTRTFTPTPTFTPLPPTTTLTPSKTITDTITPTFSPTFTASPDLGAFSGLAELLANATVIPQSTRYNPATLTALYNAGQALVAARTPTAPIAGGVFSNGAFVPFTPAPVLGATPTLSIPSAGTLIPPVGIVFTPAFCSFPPPPELSAASAGDPVFIASLGCALSPVTQVAAASQVFERGVMVYVSASGGPGQIYALNNDGSFRRFDDTWVSGVDPETSAEAAPPGVQLPVRGFLKVWSSNPDVRAALGYATDGERGDTAGVTAFSSGRAIALPSRLSIIVLVDVAPIGAIPTTGTWRVYAG